MVGVEVAEQAVREFFDENNLSFSTHKVTNAEGTLFKVGHTFFAHRKTIDLYNQS